jgi:hypothetical protein
LPLGSLRKLFNFILQITNLQIADAQKPRHNKKGQSFVVMLGFWMFFFEFTSAACCKKRHAKTEHHNKRLAILILSEL